MVEGWITKETTSIDTAQSIVWRTKKSHPESIVLQQTYRLSKNSEEEIEVEQRNIK